MLVPSYQEPDEPSNYVRPAGDLPRTTVAISLRQWFRWPVIEWESRFEVASGAAAGLSRWRIYVVRSPRLGSLCPCAPEHDCSPTCHSGATLAPYVLMCRKAVNAAFVRGDQGFKTNDVMSWLSDLECYLICAGPEVPKTFGTP